LLAVDAVSGNTAWISGYEYLARTTDGGITWTRERLPGEPFSITSLEFLTADGGWAAGTDGIWWRTP
jgi:photosystem II stability/assembly factor-like uncharacterized protein